MGITLAETGGQISLSNNQLSGYLSPTIGNFYGVQTNLLDGNKVSGRIPPEIRRLQQVSQGRRSFIMGLGFYGGGGSEGNSGGGTERFGLYRHSEFRGTSLITDKILFQVVYGNVFILNPALH